MNTRTCHNCGADKTDFEAHYCEECTKAVKEAVAQAAAEGADEGAARKTALWRRGHNPHRNRADSRTQIQRVQFNDFLNRISVQPGSPQDPRRTN